MAVLGILSLAGMLIKNALVPVDQTDIEVAESEARMDAIVDTAISLVRPALFGAVRIILSSTGCPLGLDLFFWRLSSTRATPIWRIH